MINSIHYQILFKWKVEQVEEIKTLIIMVQLYIGMFKILIN